MNAEFSRLMAGCGLARPPRALAVAVSGGADSLALALLLQDWLRPQGGQLLAIIVDHGLRPESAREAALVAGWLRQRGVAHRLCRWRPAAGDKRQARAREGRYGLLMETCWKESIGCLAFGHHRDDQAETLLLRLARGSGSDGLAGIAAVTERHGLTLLRPLLPVPKARLEATLAARGQPWVEDPSNHDVRDPRARLRHELPQLAAHGLDPARLAELARLFGRARHLLERQTQDLLRCAATLEPTGAIRLSRDALLAVSPEIARRALARCLVTVGGREHAPRSARLVRLWKAVDRGLTAPATLGGCLVIPCAGELAIVREAGRSRPALLRPGQTVNWDGRFNLRLAPDAAGYGDLWVSSLGPGGWAILRKVLRNREISEGEMIYPVRLALPALWAGRPGCSAEFNLKPLAVPLLDYYNTNLPSALVEECRFAPRRPLYERPFTVV